MIPISEKGYAFVAAREACSLTAYADTRMLAVGFGQNDPSLKPGDVITLDAAIALFVKEGRRIQGALAKLFDGYDLPQQAVDCLFSAVYNIGLGSLTRANIGLIDGVKAFSAQPRNRVLRDLAGYQIVQAHPEGAEPPFNLSRRCREAVLFLTGDYGDISTMQLWPAGKSPRHLPPDPPTVVPMPTFLKAA